MSAVGAAQNQGCVVKELGWTVSRVVHLTQARMPDSDT
jgi:hypothetical protein